MMFLGGICGLLSAGGPVGLHSGLRMEEVNELFKNIMYQFLP